MNSTILGGFPQRAEQNPLLEKRASEISEEKQDFHEQGMSLLSYLL